MALEVRPNKTSVQIKYDLGLDVNRGRITKTRTLTGIKMDAADQDIYDVVSAITDLQEPPVLSLMRIDYSEYVQV